MVLCGAYSGLRAKPKGQAPPSGILRLGVAHFMSAVSASGTNQPGCLCRVLSLFAQVLRNVDGELDRLMLPADAHLQDSLACVLVKFNEPPRHMRQYAV